MYISIMFMFDSTCHDGIHIFMSNFLSTLHMLMIPVVTYYNGKSIQLLILKTKVEFITSLFVTIAMILKLQAWNDYVQMNSRAILLWQNRNMQYAFAFSSLQEEICIGRQTQTKVFTMEGKPCIVRKSLMMDINNIDYIRVFKHCHLTCSLSIIFII